MKNPYEGIIAEPENYEALLALQVGYHCLWEMIAREIVGLGKKHPVVLEVGCGAGDSARAVLKNAIHWGLNNLVLLDLSERMIETARHNLRDEAHGENVNFVESDAVEYLKQSGKFDAIYSSMVVHNFVWHEKMAFFESIRNRLVDGGVFLLMDKVYPRGKMKYYLDRQLNRYRYLEPKLRSAITRHERRDTKKDRMLYEDKLLETLNMFKFTKVEVLERVEHNVLIRCIK